MARDGQTYFTCNEGCDYDCCEKCHIERNKDFQYKNTPGARKYFGYWEKNGKKTNMEFMLVIDFPTTIKGEGQDETGAFDVIGTIDGAEFNCVKSYSD
jgi:hypothetical protein